MVVAHKDLHRNVSEARHSSPESSSRHSSLRTQDSSYLREAAQVARALPLDGLAYGKRESSNQFEISEVVKGGGRAVYSLHDKHKIIKALNAAFGVNGNDRFAESLETKLKNFQKEMIAKDPVWQKLEANLKTQGKTLVDGLVGPLTIKALLDQGVIKMDRAHGFVAVLKSEKSEAKAYVVEKKPHVEKPRVEENQIKVKPKEKTETVKVKIDDAPKVDQRLVDLQKSLGDLKAREQKLSLRITDNLSHLQAERKGVEKSEAELEAQKLAYEKSNKFEDKFLPGATSVLPTLAKSEQSYIDLQNKQAKLRDDIQIIEKSLARVASCDERQKSQVYSTAKNLLARYGHGITERGLDTDFTKAEVDSSLRFSKSSFATLRTALTEYEAKESEIRAGIGRQVADLVKKCSEKAMPWTKEQQYSDADRKLFQRGFALCFSSASSDSLAIYKNELNSTYTRSNGIEFGMRYGKNFDTFVRNLDIESQNKQNGLSDSERKDLCRYVDSLKKCKELGIDSPMRFSPANLAEIVNERINPQTDKPLMVITAAKADWNGAFSVLDRVTTKFISQGYRVQYREVATDKEFVAALKEATQDGQFKANALCVSGHGNKKQISLSDYDPAKRDVKSSERTIDLDDKERLVEARNYVNTDASILINSCSTGEGKLDPAVRINNMANFFRDLFPQVATKSIFAPTTPANIGEIEFKDKKVFGIRSVNKNGEQVETYQANNSKLDSTYAGLS